MGKALGVDQRTTNREYEYFANVPVDIDLAKPVLVKITVEEEGWEFDREVEIQQLGGGEPMPGL